MYGRPSQSESSLALQDWRKCDVFSLISTSRLSRAGPLADCYLAETNKNKQFPPRPRFLALENLEKQTKAIEKPRKTLEKTNKTKKNMVCPYIFIVSYSFLQFLTVSDSFWQFLSVSESFRQFLTVSVVVWWCRWPLKCGGLRCRAIEVVCNHI